MMKKSQQEAEFNVKTSKEFPYESSNQFFFSVSKWVEIRVAVFCSQWFALVTNTYQLVNLLRFALLLLLLLLVASTTETLTIKSVVLEIALNFI